MVEEFDIHNDLPFSSEAGWMQMETLLNKNLPSKKRTPAFGLYYYFLPALLLLSIFLFSSLQLGTRLKKQQFAQNLLQVQPVAPVHNQSGTYPVKNHSTVKDRYISMVPDKNSQVSPAANEGPLLQSVYETDIFTTASRMEKINIQTISNGISERKGRSIPESIAVDKKINTEDALKKQQHGKASWEMAAGIGMNIAAGNVQTLQPYPMAEVKYSISNRLFVAAGVSIFSPGSAGVSGVSKTVYLNDTLNNVRLYNEVAKYNRLRYADVPISLGFNISSKIFVQAGWQVSFLLSKSYKRTVQPYDFQMNYASLPDNTSLVGAAANPQQLYNVAVRNIDHRFIAGIKYRQNRMTAGLFYQHGLQPAGAGFNTGKSGNQLFTLNLMYQIK